MRFDELPYLVQQRLVVSQLVGGLFSSRVHDFLYFRLVLRSLYFISYWEIALCGISMWDLELSLANWQKLEADATWSKATYAYGKAACLLQLGGDENVKQATALMEKVPKLCQRIAGKSIPVEVRYLRCL